MTEVPTFIANTHIYLADVPDERASVVLPLLHNRFVAIHYPVVPVLSRVSQQIGLSRTYYIQIGDDIIGLHNNQNYPILFNFKRSTNMVAARQPVKAGIIDDAAYLLFDDKRPLGKFFRAFTPLSRHTVSGLKMMEIRNFRILYRELGASP